MGNQKMYEIITDKFIKQMEQGIIPWDKPWTGSSKGAFNRVSKKPYSFLNQMMLTKTGEYASFKQWIELGGKIKKGEKSEIVVFWKPLVVDDMHLLDENGNPVKKTIFMLRYLPVFHISQIDGVEPLPESELKLNEFEDILTADEVFEQYISREGIKFSQTISDKACYSPSTDTIHMPLKEQFKEEAEYYSTLFHESTHSTGADNRLKRLKNGRFGSENYSKEELVAEIGAALMLNYLGIESDKSFRNSTAYLQSWIGALRNDKSLIVQAGSKAEKAFNYILGRTEESIDGLDESKAA